MPLLPSTARRAAPHCSPPATYRPPYAVTARRPACACSWSSRLGGASRSHVKDFRSPPLDQSSREAVRKATSSSVCCASCRLRRKTRRAALVRRADAPLSNRIRLAKTLRRGQEIEEAEASNSKNRAKGRAFFSFKQCVKCTAPSVYDALLLAHRARVLFYEVNKKNHTL